MRLTADVLARAPAFLNVVSDREIDLRANNLPAIQNLALTNDAFDSIDPLAKPHRTTRVPRRAQEAQDAAPRKEPRRHHCKQPASHPTQSHHPRAHRQQAGDAARPRAPRGNAYNPAPQPRRQSGDKSAGLPRARHIAAPRAPPPRLQESVSGRALARARLRRRGACGARGARRRRSLLRVGRHQSRLPRIGRLSRMRRVSPMWSGSRSASRRETTTLALSARASRLPETLPPARGVETAGRQATMVEAAAPAPNAAPHSQRNSGWHCLSPWRQIPTLPPWLRGAPTRTLPMQNLSTSRISNSMRVVDLRKILSARGLSKSGRKEELIRRIKESRLL